MKFALYDQKYQIAIICTAIICTIAIICTAIKKNKKSSEICPNGSRTDKFMKRKPIKRLQGCSQTGQVWDYNTE